MTSPVRVAVPVALMVFTMIIVYGALEMSDSEKSAIDILWDMMYGKKGNSQEIELETLVQEENEKRSLEMPDEPLEAVNCVLGDWSGWSDCEYNNETGDYVKKRTRTPTTSALNGGTECGPLIEEQTCPAVNCVQSDWTDSGVCNSSQGFQEQTRYTTTEPLYGGNPCDIVRQFIHCDVNCVQSDWTNSGVCNSSTGKQSQTRYTTTDAQNYGTACEGLTQEIDCDVNCIQTAWTNSGVCSKPCGTGKQSQTRYTTTYAQNDGTACGSLTKEISCNTQACPVPAVCGWTNTGSCSGSSGKQTQTRTTTTAAKHGGTACGSETQEIACTPTRFDNERVYIKDPFGGYLGQSKSNKWLHHADYQQPNRYTGIYESVVDKTYFTLDGSFDNVTIKGGVNDKYCANIVCEMDSPDDFVYAHISSMKVNGYFKFEKQSDGGFKIYPKYHDGSRTKRFIYDKSNDQIFTFSGGDHSDVFYLEAAT